MVECNQKIQFWKYLKLEFFSINILFQVKRILYSNFFKSHSPQLKKRLFNSNVMQIKLFFITPTTRYVTKTTFIASIFDVIEKQVFSINILFNFLSGQEIRWMLWMEFKWILFSCIFAQWFSIQNKFTQLFYVLQCTLAQQKYKSKSTNTIYTHP